MKHQDGRAAYAGNKKYSDNWDKIFKKDNDDDIDKEDKKPDTKEDKKGEQ